jgi:NitT/TauT family transport system substrate-binding protein
MHLRIAMCSLLTVMSVSVGCAGTSPQADGAEKPEIKVGAVPVPDSAPLYIARERGFFADEGLRVEIQQIQGGAYAIPRLISGSLDMSMLNYVSAITAQAAGAADLKIVADAYQAAPGTFLLLAAKKSPVQTPKDLGGKRIAVASLAGIATLAVESLLRTAGVPVSAVHFVTMPLPNMMAALATGQVDAALMSEPFITEGQTAIGARVVGDGMSGATADFPIAGWGCSAKWATENPRTVEAFQRAMHKAQQLAAADRKAVEHVLPSYTKIKPEIAGIMTLGAFPITLNLKRLQRVADLMDDYGYLKVPFGMSVMLLPDATSTPALTGAQQ